MYSVLNVLSLFFHAEIGVGGTCTEVCDLLEEKVNNKYVGIVCDIICLFVGFDIFVKIVEE